MDFVAEEHSGVGAGRELGAELRGRKVFAAAKRPCQPDLPAALRRYGAIVTEVVTDRKIPPSRGEGELNGNVYRSEFMGFCFTVRSRCIIFVEILGREAWANLQERVVMVAIGPTTANALSPAGVQRIAGRADQTTTSGGGGLEGTCAHKEDGRRWSKRNMSFPTQRPRRLRRSEALRGLVRETRLTTAG